MTKTEGRVKEPGWKSRGKIAVAPDLSFASLQHQNACIVCMQAPSTAESVLLHRVLHITTLKPVGMMEGGQNMV